ncbi:2Fe-2S iron-sulfur cluster-binding protein [Dyadobacter subterraneus]|uniref:2Fe-2S iron-sulfur cluster binding domain-containing protein n=1 Tax=Dyadobacter subterraneus TaxID=2773304 RepID=A0ABR9W679_9BACT|nr:2Fe-2S iron-sulfur cluster-binding protein [Dyadobacter subterraneus]MBE9460965.1 2Fe-2S iron-sulfur cluster binding domain-containing protein [Dyadobacter subterraneus]
MEQIIDSTILLRVREIIVESYDIKTFVFEQLDGGKLNYKAGQFLTFLINMHGHEIRRSYSMSSAPETDEFPSITVKRISNGEISRFWIDFVHEGDIFTVLQPTGRFTLEPSDGMPRDIILIGAGSGITPLFSILKQTLTTDPLSQVTLLYANRNEKSTLFLEKIEAWKIRFPERLHVIHIHSNPSDHWNGVRGRINNTRLEQMIKMAMFYKPERARFFICGPFELMRSVEITLHYLGFGKDQIRRENFVVRNPPTAPKESKAYDIKLIFKKEEYDLHVPADKSILQAALDSGIHLPYSCKGGVCASCAGVCKSGSVHMTINDVLTDHDLKQGWVLTCTGYPQSGDVLIEIK